MLGKSGLSFIKGEMIKRERVNNAQSVIEYLLVSAVIITIGLGAFVSGIKSGAFRIAGMGGNYINATNNFNQSTYIGKILATSRYDHSVYKWPGDNYNRQGLDNATKDSINNGSWMTPKNIELVELSNISDELSEDQNVKPLDPVEEDFFRKVLSDNRTVSDNTVQFVPNDMIFKQYNQSQTYLLNLENKTDIDNSEEMASTNHIWNLSDEETSDEKEWLKYNNRDYWVNKYKDNNDINDANNEEIKNIKSGLTELVNNTSELINEADVGNVNDSGMNDEYYYNITSVYNKTDNTYTSFTNEWNQNNEEGYPEIEGDPEFIENTYNTILNEDSNNTGSDNQADDSYIW